MGHREGSKDAPRKKTARSRQDTQDADRRLQRASHRRGKSARPGGALLEASVDSRPPRGCWAPSLGVCSPADNAAGFPSHTVALCTRTKYIINIYTASGLLSTDCETTGLFSHPMGRSLRTPRSSCPHTPVRLGSTIRAYSPQTGPEWLHEATHSLRGVRTADDKTSRPPRSTNQ